MSEPLYKMTIDMNVLNHLGINLYSNVPAVISEAVANAWDADATEVRILVDADAGQIVIKDNGCGMDIRDANERYLQVGYQKRKSEGGKSPRGRAYMGRKGIGKLSLFSIADTVEVHSVKSGVIHGFRMASPEIHQAIQRGADYYPAPVTTDRIGIGTGSEIVLTDVKKRRFAQSITALRKRLARRFSVIGSEEFKVFVNDTEVTVRDRDDLKMVQFLWEIGEQDKYRANCPNLKKYDFLDGNIDGPEMRHVHGWIGSVAKPKQLENTEGGHLNSIVVLARGRLVQEDILDRINEGGIYTKYLTGQIEADFLDLDEKDDIATSDRQRVVEDDERYRALEVFVRKCLRQIENVWTEWRNELGAEQVIDEYPILRAWIEGLPSGARKHAKRVIGVIEGLTVDDEQQRRTLLRHGVIAFERLRLREDIDRLAGAIERGAEGLLSILAEADDIEAALYHDIAKNRLEVIRSFKGLVDENEKERVLQDYLFSHLWLLDPSWERATGSALIESRVDEEFKNIDADLDDEERRGRRDIKYRTTARKHVIIELKRAHVIPETMKLVSQGRKYLTALRKCLTEANRGNEPTEIIYVVGKPLREANDQEFVRNQLASVNARVVMYDQLIDGALHAYEEFIEASRGLDRIGQILGGL